MFWIYAAAVAAMGAFLVWRWRATKRVLFPVLALLLPFTLQTTPEHYTVLWIIQGLLVVLTAFFLFFPFKRKKRGETME